MKDRAWFVNGRAVCLLSTLAWSVLALTAAAQPARFAGAQPGPRQIIIFEEEAPARAPAQPTGPLSLEQCLALGLQHQPSLDAARASVDAASIGSSSVNRLNRPLARMFRRDLPVRAQQSNLGVAIAESNLTQTEWETRYAITRNFYSVQYARSQEFVIDDVLRKLKEGRKRANEIYLMGDPKYKVSKLDLKALDVQIGLVSARKTQAKHGVERATAAMREAMGLMHDYPLEVAREDLPPAVYPTKIDGTDDKGKVIKVDGFKTLYQIKKEDMVAAALANRPEINQANLASCLVELEMMAQGRIRGPMGDTLGMGADLHVKPIPPSLYNNDYRPGAITIEMPPRLVGRKNDRVAHAAALHQRALAVVDKTNLLVALDVEAQYLKWQEAADQVEYLINVEDQAVKLVDEVQKLNPTEFTSNAVIQANFTAIMVRTQLNEAKHTHALALAGLERATAGAFRIYPIPAAPAVLPK